MSNPDKETIRRLNDRFRSSLQGGRVMMTSGVRALSVDDQAVILNLVRKFNAFSAGNDPYGEHDMGIIQHAGESVYFKIDYFDKELQHGSENPADPAQTTRVMTIMLAHEY